MLAHCFFCVIGFVHYVHDHDSRDFNNINPGFHNFNLLCFGVVDLFEGLDFVDDSALSDTNLHDVSNSDHDDFVDNIELHNILTNFDMKEDSIFLEKCVMVNAIKIIAIRNNFEFKVARSSKSRYFLVCCKTPCDWKLNASVCGDSDVWVIRKYQNVHSGIIEVVTTKHRQASVSVISECMKKEFYSGRADHMPPKDVIDHTNTQCLEVKFVINFKILIHASERLIHASLKLIHTNTQCLEVKCDTILK